jgi:malonyl-CoA O-methyltransferase
MSFRPPGSRPEKRCIARSFGAAARSYDGVAGLQRRVGRALLSRWPERMASPGIILDVGTGTGHCAAELLALHPDSCVIALDLAEGMLRVARERLGARGAGCCVCGDAEAMPLADGAVDLIFSNLAIQWCADLVAVFREFHRVLRPGGAVLFSTFGVATLSELRRAWAAVDGYSHVNDFADLRELRAAMGGAGLADLILESETQRLEYRDVAELMRELKELGAHNVTGRRPRHLTGKRALQKMMEVYQAQAPDARIRASFETILGSAVRP